MTWHSIATSLLSTQSMPCFDVHGQGQLSNNLVFSVRTNRESWIKRDLIVNVRMVMSFESNLWQAQEIIQTSLHGFTTAATSIPNSLRINAGSSTSDIQTIAQHAAFPHPLLDQ